MVEVLEPINVWVFFKNSAIQPHIFLWKERKIKIDKINLIHTSKFGATTFYHFSVLSKGNFYKLRFDTNLLKWTLESVEEDGESNTTY